MNRRQRVLFISFLVLTLVIAGQTCKSIKKTEFEITKAASESIQYLAGLGIRHAGTENEGEALEYIQKRLKKAGLKLVPVWAVTSRNLMRQVRRAITI